MAHSQTWGWVYAAPDPSANANAVKKNGDRTKNPVFLKEEGKLHRASLTTPQRSTAARVATTSAVVAAFAAMQLLRRGQP